MARTTEPLEYTKGRTWAVTVTADLDQEDMTGVTGQIEVKRRGVGVLVVNGTVPDNAVKEMLFVVPEVDQDDIEAGLHEYRVDFTVSGQTLDQAEGILYVRE
jgi:hypothetical protein